MKKSMKKISRMFIAVLMLVAMMSATVSAATATITITNADDAEIHMVQVIGVDPTSATGWKFLAGENEFKAALGVEDDAQAAIAMLVKKADSNATLPSKYSDLEAATDAQIDTALSNISITGEFKTEVSDAGLYAIRATETGYTYKDMAVYVDFEGTTTPTPLEAKKSSITIEKEIKDDDHAVAIGDTVEYTVTSTFPNIPANRTNKKYIITDTITGAEYDKESVVIMIGNEEIKDVSAVIDNDNGTLTVDLSEYITADNENAGKTVTITYEATVTATSVNNKVSHTDNESFTSDDDPVKVFTGTITLTKYGEVDTTALSGAGFNVTKKDSTEILTFSQDVDDDGNTVDGKYTYDPNGAVTEVVTGEDGTLEVKGLDLGNYHFAEVTAPDGYSINESGADAELKLGTDENGNEITVATAIFTDDTNLKDTKLSALPSTGSVGTYVFTIAGVVIMAVMLSLFTIKRRRDA